MRRVTVISRVHDLERRTVWPVWKQLLRRRFEHPHRTTLKSVQLSRLWRKHSDAAQLIDSWCVKSPEATANEPLQETTGNTIVLYTSACKCPDKRGGSLLHQYTPFVEMSLPSSTPFAIAGMGFVECMSADETFCASSRRRSFRYEVPSRAIQFPE